MSDSRLAASFAESFGGRPEFLVRAPGRVNLMGEHTDYNDLPVLPIALHRGVSLALRPRDDEKVRLVNRDPRFAPVTFEIAVSITHDPRGHWSNYPRAAAQELARRFAIYRGFDGVVASDLPVASGLSSSSALVNVVGMALAHIGEVGLKPLELADVLAEAERYTGTQGGGMDQAISLSAREGHAARIDFRPLRMRHHLIPEDWRFVVADTGVPAEKSGAAQAAYNQRRTECAEALETLCLVLAREGRVSRLPRTYPELIKLMGGTRPVLEAADSVLTGTPLKRLRHVVSEAGRVEAAEDALLMADHMEFGSLMDQSHGSLRTDFLVSSAPLDRLVATALEGGAAGARLTGAGFGGCIVALADAGTVDGVLAELRASGTPSMAGTAPEDRAFVAMPSGGARITPFPG